MESYAEHLFEEAQLPPDEPTSPLTLARRHGVHLEYASWLGPLSYELRRAASVPRVHSIVLNDALSGPETYAACARAFAELRRRDHDVEQLAAALLLPGPALSRYAPDFGFQEDRIANFFCVPVRFVGPRIYALRLAVPLQSATRMRAASPVNDVGHRAVSSR